MKLFDESELDTPIDHEINSLIMSEADDIAEKLTELECKLNGIKCYDVTIENDAEVSTYTEEAQEIFNQHYDEQVTNLYKLLNAQIKIIQEN